MVDAVDIVDMRRSGTRTGSRAAEARAGFACEARPFDSAARAEYAEFCGLVPHATPQSPSFVSAWADEPDADMVMASIAEAGQTSMMLVLEVVRDGAAVVARHPGGRHANGSFPAFAGTGPSDLREGLAEAVRRARPEIDLVLLERNEREREGRANPLLGAGCSQSPNVALAVNLEGGFDATLERASGKRKLKKHRAQIRKFEAAGGYRCYRAATAGEVDALLDGFYAMKAERFRHMGITDVFADAGVKRAFRRMFVGALDRDNPDFILHGLEVGGRLRAVTACSVSGGRITCEFSAFWVDELSSASPGEFLFFEDVRRACEDGLAVYDFGVGDEPYKRTWCDIENRHFDFYLPLTARGHAISATRRATGAVKRAVKENRTLWSIVKRLRRSGA
jgi:CelD/BcsL family acetyltransferase involved in cellulose biosynthesis